MGQEIGYLEGSLQEIKDEIEGAGSGAGIRLRVFLIFFDRLEA